MRVFWIITALCLLLSIYGCNDEAETRDIITISKDLVSMQGSDEMQLIEVQSSCSWWVYSDVDWIHISPSKGDRDMVVDIRVDEGTETLVGNVFFCTGRKEDVSDDFVSPVTGGKPNEVSYGRMACLSVIRKKTDIVDTVPIDTVSVDTIPIDSILPPEILPIPDTINLGLSVKWANFNLGASRPEEFGYYYDFGAIKPKVKAGSMKEALVDGFLIPEYDAATVNLGSNWRLPTWAEFSELSKNLKWINTTINGVYGVLGTASNGNTIFFPSAGAYQDDSYIYENLGLYLTSKQWGFPTMTFVAAPDREGTNNYLHEFRSVRPVYVGE